MAERKKPERVVLLILDSVDDGLVSEGMDEGRLPVMANLVRSGWTARIDDQQRTVPGSLWATWITGSPYHEHLTVAADRLRPGGYAIEQTTPELARRPPFWGLLSDAGIPSTLLGMPAEILPDFLGTQVAAWGSVTQYAVNQGARSSPPEALGWLDAEVGVPRVTFEGSVRTKRDLTRNADRLLEEVGRQGAGIRLLMERTSWRFFASAFTQAHQAGHLLWHLQDPSHPKHDRTFSDEHKRCISLVYELIDGELGRIVDLLPSNTLLLLMAQEGMGPNVIEHDPTDLLLEAGGWLRRTSRISDSGGRAWALRSGRELARKVLPAGLRDQIGIRLPGERWWREIRLTNVDWPHTRAFGIPSDVSSFVRVNLAGREPGGIVRPGQDYQALLDELTREFEALVDDETGETAAQEIVQVERSISEPVGDVLPDLIVAWHHRPPFRRLRSPRFGVVDLPQDDIRTGQHRPVGWMVATGPGVPAGDGLRLTGPSNTLLDIAPTILAAFDVPSPTAFRGLPIRWAPDQNSV